MLGLLATAVLLIGLTFWLVNRPVAAQISTETAVSLPTIAVIADTPTSSPSATLSAEANNAASRASATSIPTVPPTATPIPPATATASATVTSLPTQTATAEPTETTIPTSTPNVEPQVIVNVDRLNIRSGPSTEYPILEVADQGQAYAAIGSVSAQDWWQICCVNGEQIGWVFAGSILFEGEAGAVPPAAVIPPVPTATETAVP